MATHSRIPAWRIPRTEEPGGLQSMSVQSPTRLKRLSVYVSLGSVVDPCFYTYSLNFMVKIAVCVLIRLYLPQVSSWSFS